MGTDTTPNPFDPVTNGRSLGQNGIRSSFNVLGFSTVRFAIQLVSLVVLARLLNPADYGLMGMIATATGFAALFRDMGLSVATIQKPDLTHTDVNDAFWLNVYASLGLLIILLLISPLIATFYDEPRLKFALPVVSLTFLASGCSVQHSAILRRQMKFFQIGLIETLSILSGFLTSLALAFLGAGYWSLVGGVLMMDGQTCLFYWLICRWRPSRPTRLTKGGNLIHVGSHMLAINVISYFSTNLDRILVGHFFGKSTLGLYNRSISIVSLPTLQLITPISTVMLPMFSRLRDQPDQYQKTILSSLRLMIAITAPAVALMVACPEPVIEVLLGSKWMSATAILPILALSYATHFLPNNLGLILIVAGRFRQTLKWNGIHFVLVILGLALGLNYGLVGVAAGYTIAVTISRVPILFSFVCAASQASARKLFMVCFPLWAVAALSGFITFQIKGYADGFSPLPSLIGLSLVTGLTYAALLCLLPAGHDVFRDVRRIIQEILLKTGLSRIAT